MKQEIIRIDLRGVNCYLIKAEDNYVLFDTGGHLMLDRQFTNRREELLNKLDAVGCKTGNLKLIVLTHGDSDHTANAAFLRKKYGAKIALHPNDSELVENPTVQKAMENCNYQSLGYKLVFKLMKRQIVKLIKKGIDVFEKFSADIFLGEGDSLEEYGFDAVILHTPGHTPGSIAVMTRAGEVISGDTFANLKRPSSAPNASDFETLFRSVERLKTMDIKMVYPGHGAPFKLEELA